MEQIPAYFDVSGDLSVAPLDALLVIRRINAASAIPSAAQQAAASGEAPPVDIPVNLIANGSETLVNTTTKRMQLNPAASAASL